jgi:hypothetical protein
VRQKKESDCYFIPTRKKGEGGRRFSSNTREKREDLQKSQKVGRENEEEEREKREKKLSLCWVSKKLIKPKKKIVEGRS